ncbi:hypothetical protein C8Q79DRAFT_243638 [Trametes meyenii]|nr:hypothetical protein C8Q79DRAFT_243638 [Trametes meyenii]
MNFGTLERVVSTASAPICMPSYFDLQLYPSRPALTLLGPQPLRQTLPDDFQRDHDRLVGEISNLSAAQEMYEDPYSMPAAGTIAYGSRLAHAMRCTVNYGDSESSSGNSSHSGSSSSKSTLNPAVPALIAITVFILACVVMAKAIRGLRGERVIPVYRRPGQNSEEKPRMWEVRLDETCASPYAALGRWSEMMPVGIEYIQPCAPVTLASLPSAPSRLSASVTRDSHRSSKTIIPENSSADEKAPIQTAHLRVAVLITMPTYGSNALAAPAPVYLGIAHA